MISSPTDASVVHLHDIDDATTAHCLWTFTLHTYIQTALDLLYNTAGTGSGFWPNPTQLLNGLKHKYLENSIFISPHTGSMYKMYRKKQDNVHRVPKLATPLEISSCKSVNTWRIFAKCETFMETIILNYIVFKVCARSGHLWPRRKLLGGCTTAWSPCHNTLVKFTPCSLDSGYAGAAHQHHWPSPCTHALDSK